MELDTQRIIDEVATEQLNAEDFFVEPEDADTHDFILPELVDLTNEVGEVLSRLSDDKQALILDKMIRALDPTPRVFVRYNGFIPLLYGDDAAELNARLESYEAIEEDIEEWDGELTKEMKEWLLTEEYMWQIVLFYVTEKRYCALRPQQALLESRLKPVLTTPCGGFDDIRNVRTILSEYYRKTPEESVDLLGKMITVFEKDDKVFTRKIVDRSKFADWLSEAETWASLESLSGGKAKSLDDGYVDALCYGDEHQVKNWLREHEYEILDVALMQFTVFRGQIIRKSLWNNGVDPLNDLLLDGRVREDAEWRARKDPDVIAAEARVFHDDDVVEGVSLEEVRARLREDLNLI